MTAAKTNERPGTRAEAKYLRVSAYKAREVLDLIRDLDVRSADEVLQFSERDVAIPIRKLLRSAVANAEHNDEQIADDLYVSACFADEGKTIRRMRPRARGRATRIRKRTCNITIIVSRLPEDRLERRRAKEESRPGSRAARRAGQEAAEARSGRTRRGRRGQGAEATAAEVAATEDAEGIVDQQAVVLAEGEAPEGAQAEGIVDQQDATLAATDVDATQAPTAGAAESAGIVDQQEAAVAEAEGATTGADEAPTAADIAAAELDAGIVDQQAVEAAEIEQDADDADGEKS
jgi:large subunit ribosomal protein L22